MNTNKAVSSSAHFNFFCVRTSCFRVWVSSCVQNPSGRPCWDFLICSIQQCCTVILPECMWNLTHLWQNLVKSLLAKVWKWNKSRTQDNGWMLYYISLSSYKKEVIVNVFSWMLSHFSYQHCVKQYPPHPRRDSHSGKWHIWILAVQQVTSTVLTHVGASFHENVKSSYQNTICW